jgi:hypothetical protein
MAIRELSSKKREPEPISCVDPKSGILAVGGIMFGNFPAFPRIVCVGDAFSSVAERLSIFAGGLPWP